MRLSYPLLMLLRTGSRHPIAGMPDSNAVVSTGADALGPDFAVQRM